MDLATLRKYATDFASAIHGAVAETLASESADPAAVLDRLTATTAEFFETIEQAAAQANGELYKLSKVNEELRTVWGWASISTVKGQPFVDSQDDIIETRELQKAAHEFMTDYRRGDAMHMVKGVGRIVESVVFTDELQKALGIDLGMEGWLIGFTVDDDAVWQKVKDGTYRAFSIGGSGKRERATV